MSRNARQDARKKRRRRERNERWCEAANRAEARRRRERVMDAAGGFVYYEYRQQPMRLSYMTIDPATGKTSIVGTP